MWMKTRRATAHALQALRELLDRLVDACLVARGERHEQLLHDVRELGEPDVVTAQLQHVGLERLDTSGQVLVRAPHPAGEVLQSHWATNRPRLERRGPSLRTGRSLVTRILAPCRSISRARRSSGTGRSFS